VITVPVGTTRGFAGSGFDSLRARFEALGAAEVLSEAAGAEAEELSGAGAEAEDELASVLDVGAEDLLQPAAARKTSSRKDSEIDFRRIEPP
jgi:hypothetical protein